MKKHLAIFSKETVNEIFAGKKRIEAWFSQKKIAPFGFVRVGDLVYIKPRGEDIKGQFLVKKVILFEGLDEIDWQYLQKQNGFEVKKSAKFATLILLSRVEQFITAPIKIAKKDQRGWVVLD
jgi:hypothetical protein